MDRKKYIRSKLVLFLAASPIVALFAFLTLYLKEDMPGGIFVLGAAGFISLLLVSYFALKAESAVSEHAKALQSNRRTVDAAHSFILDSMIELRRPLQGLVGIRDLYGIESASPETKEYMDVVDHCTSHMANQLDRLQFFAEISLQSVPKNNKNFDVRGLATETINSVTSRLIGRSASIIKVIESNVPQRASGAVKWLQPLLIEMIDCGLRASGSGKLRLCVSRDALSPHELIFTLKDEVGFSEKTLREMEREINEEACKSPWSGKALGLGVPILRSLIKSLGGRFWVSGGASETISLHLSLPLTMDPLITAATEIQPEKEISTHYHLPSEQILVVDDDPLVRNLLSSLLGRMGQKITVAPNGHAAVELCRKHLFGIIFMDMDMPIMTGWDAADTILNKLHLPHPPKIIGVSSHTREQDRKKGMDIGMYTYLNKPAGAKELRAILEGFGLSTNPPEHHQPDGDIKSIPTPSNKAVDFSRMLAFYNDDSALCRKILIQAQCTLPNLALKLEEALLKTDQKTIRHALHQMKGEFAICMCNMGISVSEKLMAYEESLSQDFKSDFEELSKVIAQALREIDEITDSQAFAA